MSLMLIFFLLLTSLAQESGLKSLPKDEKMPFCPQLRTYDPEQIPDTEETSHRGGAYPCNQANDGEATKAAGSSDWPTEKETKCRIGEYSEPFCCNTGYWKHRLHRNAESMLEIIWSSEQICRDFEGTARRIIRSNVTNASERCTGSKSES